MDSYYQGPGLGTLPELESASVCDLLDKIKRVSLLQPDRTIVNKNDLISYAHLFQIPTEGLTDYQLIEKILQKAPCGWIERVKDWALQNPQAADLLNKYVTDYNMHVLSKLREGEELTEEEREYLKDVDSSIINSPRPDLGFIAYRGWYGHPGKVGDIVTLTTPKSGSFSLDPIFSGYLSFGEIACCLVELYIPKGAILSYHPSEDQIIFPSGAQFYLTYGPTIEQYPVFGEMESVQVYQAIYLGVNQVLTEREEKNLYDRLPKSDLYYLAIKSDLLFPYGNDPAQLLAQSDQSLLKRVASGQVEFNEAELRLYLLLRGDPVEFYAGLNREQLIQLIRKRSL